LKLEWAESRLHDEVKTFMKTTKTLFGILTITTALAVHIQAQVPFTNSLVAYYPFNGSANDATGNGNNGTIIGDVVPATDRFGVASNAYHFGGSGTDSAIEVTNTVFNIGQAGYTVSGWFASDNVADTYQVLWNTIPESGSGLDFNDPSLPGTAATVAFGVGPGSGAWTVLGVHGSMTNYASQTWYQAVFTKSNTLYTLYIDGQVSCQTNISAASGYNHDVGCIIGSITPINPPYPYTFLGALDDFRIYNRALSPNEVQQLYAYESAPQDQVPFTNSLVAYYPFNGNAKDATGNGNNGTIIGDVVLATDRFGNASSAYHFGGSGTDSAIEVTNTLFNIGQAGYTVSGWFASDNVSASDQTIFNTIPETGMGLDFNDPDYPGAVGFGVGPCNGTWTINYVHGSYTNYANQTWYQEVFTKSNTLYTLYINGQMSCQTNVPAASGYDYNVGGIIGSITPINPPYPYTFLGRLDDYRIYNRALSPNEVQQLYAYESAPPPCSTPSPATATATVVGGSVVAITITDGGCGYTNTPTILIVGGGGSGATGTAVVSNGVVTGITITAGGSGYTSIPTVDIASPLSTPTAPVPFTNSLVAYYPFDGNANDATGNGNNGTIIGDVVPATDRFGIASNAYHFGGSGTDSAIEVTNTLFNIGQPGYTVSGWFASDNVSAYIQPIFNTIPESGVSTAFNDGAPYAGIAVGPCNGTWTVLDFHGTSTNYANQTWYQQVFTKSNTLYTLYINGQLSCQTNISAASGYNYNVGGIIGSITPINPPFPYTFLGRLDDFRIYNRALSSSEVQQLYAYESAPSPCIPCPAAATATVVDGFVVAATVTDGGCCYTNPPPVLIVGGGGTGAAASAVVSNGVITGITITDAGIGYTNTPALYIYSPLFMTAQPQSVVVNAYGTATFNAAASGTLPLSYQWSLNDTNIPGATSNSLTISNVVQTNLGTYAVLASDIFGSVTSSNAMLEMYPFIAAPFTGALTYWGKDAALSVEAWGSGLSYQWFDNGVAISGATNSTLDFSSIQLTNAGLYSVVISSPLGSVTNAPAQVVVNPAGVSLGLYPGVTISGVVGYHYIIQTTTDLSNTNSWVTLTNLTLTQPIQLWVDTNTDASLPANPLRLYQVLPGQ
jgi:hypothetical protein